MAATRSAILPKKREDAGAVVKVNEEQVRDSPFPVQVKPRQFRPVLSFGQQGSSAGSFKEPFGVAVNERDEIAVTDLGNDRV